MRTGSSMLNIANLFGVSSGTVSKVVDEMISKFHERFVKTHLGFNPLHKITIESVLADKSTWFAKEVEKYWSNEDLFGDDVKIFALIDGRHYFCGNIA